MKINEEPVTFPSVLAKIDSKMDRAREHRDRAERLRDERQFEYWSGAYDHLKDARILVGTLAIFHGEGIGRQ